MKYINTIYIIVVGAIIAFLVLSFYAWNAIKIEQQNQLTNKPTIDHFAVEACHIGKKFIKVTGWAFVPFEHFNIFVYAEDSNKNRIQIPLSTFQRKDVHQSFKTIYEPLEKKYKNLNTNIGFSAGIRLLNNHSFNKNIYIKIITNTEEVYVSKYTCQ